MIDLRTVLRLVTTMSSVCSWSTLLRFVLWLFVWCASVTPSRDFNSSLNFTYQSNQFIDRSFSTMFFWDDDRPVNLFSRFWHAISSSISLKKVESEIPHLLESWIQNDHHWSLLITSTIMIDFIQYQVRWRDFRNIYITERLTCLAMYLQDFSDLDHPFENQDIMIIIFNWIASSRHIINFDIRTISS